MFGSQEFRADASASILGELGRLLSQHKRHPQIAVECLRELGVMSDSPTLAEASMAARDLDGVMGFEPPSWDALLRGVRPPSQEWDQQEPCEVGGRWSEETRDFCDIWPKQELVGNFPSPTKSGGCVVDAMARYHGLQRCQILCSVSPRITDVRE